jgi:hypothetical protein
MLQTRGDLINISTDLKVDQLLIKISTTVSSLEVPVYK